MRLRFYVDPSAERLFVSVHISVVNGRIGEEQEGRRQETDGFWGPWDVSLPSRTLSWSKSQALIGRGPKTQTAERPMGTSERKPLSASRMAVQRAGVGQGTCLPLSGHRSGT